MISTHNVIFYVFRSRSNVFRLHHRFVFDITLPKFSFEICCNAMHVFLPAWIPFRFLPTCAHVKSSWIRARSTTNCPFGYEHVSDVNHYEHQFSFRGSARGRQAPRLKASYLGLRPVGPTLTAVRPASLHSSGRRAPTIARHVLPSRSLYS